MSPTLHQEGKVWTSEEGQDGQEAGGGARGGGRQSFPRGHRRSSGPCEPRVPSSTVRAPMRRVRGRLPSRLPASLQGSKAPSWTAPVPQPLRCPVPTVASPASTEPHMQPRKKYHLKLCYLPQIQDGGLVGKWSLWEESEQEDSEEEKLRTCRPCTLERGCSHAPVSTTWVSDREG